ncbi:MAG TPA: 5-formyltetrahydrofolate cyclo-ligase [Candidatus Fimivivens faecavium]|nr:5-formyltetrahydrofolate cyclo-ligase [Candidatus Fimivivens faecavium]
MTDRPVNLKEYKNELRRQQKAFRSSLPTGKKRTADERIARRLFSLPQYREAKLVLIYVSTAIEVDTRKIIRRALAAGKQVAVPRCVAGTRLMEFYRIGGIEELSPGAFGVLEPEPDPANKVTDFSNSICVVPALGCDLKGYRLGYGGGYYDRFLSGYGGCKALIIYKFGILKKLWHGRYDVPVHFVITEYFTRKIPQNHPRGGTGAAQKPPDR